MNILNLQSFVLISSDHDSGFEGSKDIQCVHSEEEVHTELERPVDEEQCGKHEQEETLIQQQDIDLAINDEVSGAMLSFLMLKITDYVDCHFMSIKWEFG